MEPRKDCVIGKMTRSEIHKVSSTALEAFDVLDVVRTDNCDPSQTESRDAARFFFTFTDKGSRFVRFCPVRLKSDSLSDFMRSQAMPERQTK